METLVYMCPHGFSDITILPFSHCLPSEWLQTKTSKKSHWILKCIILLHIYAWNVKQLAGHSAYLQNGRHHVPSHLWIQDFTKGESGWGMPWIEVRLYLVQKSTACSSVWQGVWGCSRHPKAGGDSATFWYILSHSELDKVYFLGQKGASVPLWPPPTKYELQVCLGQAIHWVGNTCHVNKQSISTWLYIKPG